MQDYSIIPPHKYPAGIIVCAALLLVSIVYSLKFFPAYFVATKRYSSGIAAYNKKNYPESIEHLKSVLEIAPTSRKAKIAIAKSFFAIGTKEIQEIGLDYLEGLRLNKEEWNDIKSVMPTEYESFFKTTR